MVNRSNTLVDNLVVKSQLQSEEELTDQRSSHFKLNIAVNFNHCRKKSAPSLDRALDRGLDLSFGTVMTKLKLFHVVEKKMYHAKCKIFCHDLYVNSYIVIVHAHIMCMIILRA